MHRFFKNIGWPLTPKAIMLALILILIISIFATPAFALTYTGTISSSPTMSLDPYCAIPNLPYDDAGIVVVDTTGNYLYTDTSFFASGFDSVMFLYTAPFDPL